MRECCLAVRAEAGSGSFPSATRALHLDLCSISGELASYHAQSPGLEDRTGVARATVEAIEHVQTKPRCQLDAHLDATSAVPESIKTRRVRANAELLVDHGEDAAADATFCGHTNAVGPLARVVVHATGKHDGQHVLDGARIVSNPSRDRIAPHVRQR